MQALEKARVGFEFSASFVAESILASYELPAEPFLQRQLSEEGKIPPEFTYANSTKLCSRIAHFYANPALLSEALDVVANTHAETLPFKGHLVSNLDAMRVERVRWLANEVLPVLWNREHAPQNPAEIRASAQASTAILVDLPPTAWALKDAHLTGTPTQVFPDYAAAYSEWMLLTGK